MGNLDSMGKFLEEVSETENPSALHRRILSDGPVPKREGLCCSSGAQMKETMKKGDKRTVFEPKIWHGRDRRNNEHCWNRATILRVYYKDGLELADVKFESGRISLGHFTSAMRD